jgi:hypothetical protein
MKKRLFYLLLCLPFALSAQLAFDPAGQIAQFSSPLTSRTGNLPIFDLGLDNIKGSPYTIPTYCDGEVWMTKNRHYKEGYQFKYDETQNVVRAVNLQTGLELELNKYEVLGLKLDYQAQFIIYITMEIPDNAEGEKCLMQVVYHSPKYSLIKRPSKTFEQVKKQAINPEESYSIYKPHPDYYFRKNKEPYEKIKLNKKAFKAQLTSQEAALEKLFDKPEYKGTLTDWKASKILQTIDSE